MPKKIILNEIGVPVVVDGEPRPWWPESFIEWLEPRLRPDMCVFEWGSGNSTLWLSGKVEYVQSVEHHTLWHRALKSIYPDDVVLKFRSNAPGYEVISSITKMNLILVDGVRREECIYNAAGWLTGDGVIILDNSDSEALEAQQWLRDQGFSEKVFIGEYAWGANGEQHSTTVFYKDGNCLGI